MMADEAADFARKSPSVLEASPSSSLRYSQLEKIFLFFKKEDLFQLGQTHLFVAGNQPAC